MASWPREADLHRPEIEGICRKYLELRYQLMPYIYSIAAQSHRTGMPMMRALWLSHPEDSKASLIEDSYLWGDSLLVAPVCEKYAVSRVVYLPRGQWWNYWTTEKVDGGKDVLVSAPLDTLPLFVKAGGILPTGPVKQFTGDTSNTPPTLRIFPGADGNFEWYEDDGETFEFEQGRFSKLQCHWDEKHQTLTITPNHNDEVARQINVAVAGHSALRQITVGKGVVSVTI